jgi:hypothetical protein
MSQTFIILVTFITFFKNSARRLLIKFKKRVVLLVVIGLITVALMKKQSIECDPAIIINSGFSEIPASVMSSRNIYFLETHNSSDHELTTRAACSIESAG